MIVDKGQYNTPNSGKLDYGNIVDLTSSLDTVNDTYTIPKNGIVNVQTFSQAPGENYYALEKVASGVSLGVVVYHRSYETSYPGVMTTEIHVNAGDILKVNSLNNRTAYNIKYYPYVP